MFIDKKARSVKGWMPTYSSCIFDYNKLIFQKSKRYGFCCYGGAELVDCKPKSIIQVNAERQNSGVV